jgi:hypothetical protein
MESKTPYTAVPPTVRTDGWAAPNATVACVPVIVASDATSTPMSRLLLEVQRAIEKTSFLEGTRDKTLLLVRRGGRTIILEANQI